VGWREIRIRLDQDLDADCRAKNDQVGHEHLGIVNKSVAFVVEGEERSGRLGEHGWPWSGLPALLLPPFLTAKRERGTERRKLIATAWQDGSLDELPDDLLASTLPDQAREYLGRIHPAFMGGE
jgi:hypothetical protein